ncbi:MAG TPA: ribonuclease P protein component [Candidatus Acidoferrales bacterium]|nr:ribonuclease P protein component [Candidatus Acidoferrales bacterium]
MAERTGADADTRDASVSGAPSTNIAHSKPVKRNLPRESRLVRRSEFEAVYREGRRRSSSTFLIFLRGNGLPRNRFGMSVKKALGNAVVRNRIRRRIREVLRLHREEILPGWDVVIHPSRSVATLEFTKLEADLLALLPRDKRAAK